MDEWPKKEKEEVSQCPICGHAERKLLHESLLDYLFGAPGAWDLYQCKSCNGAYLNPRPKRTSLALAYHRYYTHAVEQASKLEIDSFFKWVRRGIRNGYLRGRYPEFDQQPKLVLGRLVVSACYSKRAAIENHIRHLPRPDISSKLLDIGCGNGDFLLLAKAIGYQAVGLEFDPQAVAIAKKRGLEVIHGSLPGVEIPSSSYNVVTLNHVLEHLHDPVATLIEIRRLLKPDGTLWLATPNIESSGCDHFGPYWRGLEPPRHLFVFSPASLIMALKKAGFTKVEFKWPGPVSRWYFEASKSLALLGNQGAAVAYEVDKSKIAEIDSLACHNPRKAEELVVIAS